MPRITIIGVLSAVVLVATACTDSAATSSEAPAGTAETTETSVPSVAATPPGTTLAIGQKANIPYDDGVHKAMLDVIVTAIEPGDPAQYKEVFAEDAEGSTPFYIRYTMRNLSDVDLSAKTLFVLFGSTVKGKQGTGITLFGEMPDCRHVLTPEDFTTVGATFEDCYLVAAPTGQEVIEAGYGDVEYDQSPIVWVR